MLTDKSEKAKEFLENEITRSIKRAPALGYQMFSQMKLIHAYTKSGIYLGQKTMYSVSDLDRDRLNRVVKKIVQGLFYHEFKSVVPKDWIIKIVWITPRVEKNLKLIELAQTLKWNVIKEDTFAYGFNFVLKTYQSVWIIDLFKVPLFYILLMDKEPSTIKESNQGEAKI